MLHENFKFKDPVIALKDMQTIKINNEPVKKGHTYEKKLLIQAKAPKDAYVTNWAIKKLIEKTNKQESLTIEDFRCPINYDTYTKPVTTCLGHTYEEKDITIWFDYGHNTDPSVNKKLKKKTLVPNITLQQIWKNLKKHKYPNLEKNIESAKEIKNKISEISKKISELKNGNYIYTLPEIEKYDAIDKRYIELKNIAWGFVSSSIPPYFSFTNAMNKYLKDLIKIKKLHFAGKENYEIIKHRFEKIKNTAKENKYLSLYIPNNLEEILKTIKSIQENLTNLEKQNTTIINYFTNNNESSDLTFTADNNKNSIKTLKEKIYKLNLQLTNNNSKFNSIVTDKENIKKLKTQNLPEPTIKIIHKIEKNKETTIEEKKTIFDAILKKDKFEYDLCQQKLKKINIFISKQRFVELKTLYVYDAENKPILRYKDLKELKIKYKIIYFINTKPKNKDTIELQKTTKKLKKENNTNKKYTLKKHQEKLYRKIYYNSKIEKYVTNLWGKSKLSDNKLLKKKDYKHIIKNSELFKQYISLSFYNLNLSDEQKLEKLKQLRRRYKGTTNKYIGHFWSLWATNPILAVCDKEIEKLANKIKISQQTKQPTTKHDTRVSLVN